MPDEVGPHCSKCCPVEPPKPEKGPELSSGAALFFLLAALTVVAAWAGVVWLIWKAG
ncbi:hypothetical protein [Streptomyces sp. NBC_01304]|uniref:hypothetical protein n=1 Tax=Streptomyces sp. NBC_01304 TaxID=2903818 RepID=UPI002E0F5036|nr:hypothetical protein OG430_24215 [Streptomyces sp. NBC_01304]